MVCVCVPQVTSFALQMGSISSNTSSLLDSPTKDSLWTNWRNTFKKKSSSSSSCSSLQLSGCSLDESASDPFLTSETSSHADVVQSPNRPKRNYVGFTPARLVYCLLAFPSHCASFSTPPSPATSSPALSPAPALPPHFVPTILHADPTTTLPPPPPGVPPVHSIASLPAPP